jgi:hypothetical protein
MDLPAYLDDLVLDGLRAGQGSGVNALVEYLDFRNHVRYTVREVESLLHRLEVSGRATRRDGQWAAAS